MRYGKFQKEEVKILLFVSMFLAIVALNGCSTTGGVTVAPEERIAVVPDQLQKGTWESNIIVLEYEFVKEGGTLGLLIDGKTRRKTDQVLLWVLFLDGNGKLIERQSVFNSGFRTKRSRARRIEGIIERAFEVPEGTKYMAFQSRKNPYRGR